MLKLDPISVMKNEVEELKLSSRSKAQWARWILLFLNVRLKIKKFIYFQS